MSLAEIKKLLGSEKLVIGTDRALKELKKSNVKRVFVSSNAPELEKDEIKRFADIGEVDLVELDVSNEELGTVCKKPFPVSVICEIIE